MKLFIGVKKLWDYQNDNWKGLSQELLMNFRNFYNDLRIFRVKNSSYKEFKRMKLMEKKKQIIKYVILVRSYDENRKRKINKQKILTSDTNKRVVRSSIKSD